MAHGLAGVLVVLGGWEAAYQGGILGSTSVPSASDVLVRFPALIVEPTFADALGETLKSTLLGLLLGTALAIPLGVLIGLTPWLNASLRAVLEFLKPIPVVALLPLALLVFGITLEMKVYLIAFGTLWPLLIQMIYGVQSVDPLASATARSFRVTRLRRFAFVLLPSASPYIATGLRVAGVSALLLSVVTEMVGGAPGLGREIQRAQSAVQFVDLYAYVVLTGLLGILLNTALEAGERRALHWHPSHREGA